MRRQRDESSRIEQVNDNVTQQMEQTEMSEYGRTHIQS